MPPIFFKGMWINQALKEAMNVIQRKKNSMRRASKSWNILINSLVDHLNRKTKSKKMAPRGVLT
jgi:hypothetical protein